MSDPTSAWTGRVAFVTGGASGIGAACVRALHTRGASVMIADRDVDTARALATSLGPLVDACALDAGDPDDTAAAIEATLARFSALDMAVNSAGVGVASPAKIADLDDAQWRRVTDVNLDGVFYSVRAEIRAMLPRGGGSIVNISSIMGTIGTVGAAAYVAAKHGVVGLTKAAALEYAGDGIRVNAILPGHIATAMWAAHPEEMRARVTAEYPSGRIGRPEDIAETACFLLSPEAAFVNGVGWLVDGARTIT